MVRTTKSNVGKFPLAALSLFLAGSVFCAPFQDPELVKYVNDALDIMEEHSIYQNIVYWEEFREIAFERAEELTELSDAHKAIEEALLRLGDRHGRLIPPDELDALANDGLESSRLEPWTPGDAKLIGDRIGYITVPNVAGRSKSRVNAYVDEMHEAMKNIDSDDVCAWIVDLRKTTGGNISALVDGIVPILGSGVVGGQVGPDGKIHVYRVEDGRSWQDRRGGRAYKLKNRNPPVAALIGQETSGSGEAIALTFLGREMSLTFGEPTAGLTTLRAPFMLSDGSALALSRSILTDRINRLYFKGIRPQVRATDKEIINVAVKWLESSDPCQ